LSNPEHNFSARVTLDMEGVVTVALEVGAITVMALEMGSCGGGSLRWGCYG